jgi:CRISPR/Cas system-associated endoribonuclease Cas2
MATEDDIKIYPLCKSCVEKVECHGKAVLNTEEEVIVI